MEADLMNVSLTKELEKYVHQKVESGLYSSASEVIREGLRILQERDELRGDRLEKLRQEIALGIEDADQGKLSPFDEETLQEIEAEGRKRWAAEPGSKAR
jgi:antitoxin ParD1/3/4